MTRSGTYLDAHVLACPPSGASQSAFLEYVSNLIAWTELRRADWLRVYISRSAPADLSQTNSYPPFPLLKKAVDTLGIKYVQPKDIAELVNGLLLRSFIVEEELGIDTLILEDFSTEPAIPFQRRREPYPDHFRRLLVLIALHHRFVSEMRNQILITSPDIEYEGSVALRATVSDWLTEESSAVPDDTPKPMSVFDRFYLCNCPRSLYISLDPCTIWANARSDAALKKAIEVFAYQRLPREGPYRSPIQPESFIVGSRFLESCRVLGFRDDPVKIRLLLRACVETILGINARDSHWLRTSIGPGSPQLKNGNDAAWRRDIDHEYHLHYWATHGGPLFANVVRHNDFSIVHD